MKRIIIFLLPVICFSCLESDYLETPLVSFVGKTGETVDAKELSSTTVRLRSTGSVSESSTITISISDTEGVVTDPIFDVFTGKIDLQLAAGDSVVDFTIKYQNNELKETKDIEFVIEKVGGSLKGIGNDLFVLRAQGAVKELPQIEGTVTIEEALGMSGKTVSIVAVVSSPDYGFSNGQYFIQDLTGGLNAIHFGSQGNVKRNDIVAIKGQIGEYSSQPQINVESVEVLSKADESLLAPITISETDLQLANLDPSKLGRIVSISGVSLDDEDQWPTTAIDASSGVNVNATVGTTGFVIRIDRGESFYDGSPKPGATFTLTGVFGRFNDDLQIFPFVEGDIQ